MLISIIVPFYNAEKYIHRCYESIRFQTYSNLECIFVDDCSSDNSLKLLKSKISKYIGSIKFHLIQHKTNRGLSVSRNNGVSVANGDYLFFLDADDQLLPNSITTLVMYASKYPDAQVIQGNTLTLPRRLNHPDWRDIKKKFPNVYYNDEHWVRAHCFSPPRIPVQAWNKLIKKSFVLNNDLKFKEGIIHEDELWMFYVSQFLKSICFVKQYTLIHYIVPDSIMQNNAKHQKSIASYYSIIQEIDPIVKKSKFIHHRKYLVNAIRKNKMRMDQKDNVYYSLYNKLILRKILVAFLGLNLRELLCMAILLLPPKYLHKNICIKKFIKTQINHMR